jgi:hypothetical protein
MLTVDRFDEVMALSAVDLDELVRSRELERRAIDADLAIAAAVVGHRRQFLDDGHRSVRGYLKAQINCSGAEANRIRRLGQVLDAVPAVGDALGSGRIGGGQADRLARANAHLRAGHRFAEFAPALIEHAEHLGFDDFGAVVERFVILADVDGAFDDRKFHEDEANATVSAGEDGVHVNVTGGTALQAAEIKAVFDRAVDVEFRNDVAARRAMYGDDALSHPLPRTSRQRRFAAEYAIHMAYPSAAAATAHRPHGSRPLVNIIFSAGWAARTMAEHGLLPDVDVFGDAGAVPKTPAEWLDQRCATSTGIAIHPDDAVRAMIAGHIRRVVLDSSSVVINYGRKQRLFTGEARQAAQLMAVNCSHIGCDIPAHFCDVDHLDRWTDSGETVQHNAGPLCGSHNRFKDREKWRSRRATDGRIYQIRPDDTVVMPVGQRQPEWENLDRRTIPWSEFRSPIAAGSSLTDGTSIDGTTIAEGAWKIYTIDHEDLPELRRC